MIAAFVEATHISDNLENGFGSFRSQVCFCMLRAADVECSTLFFNNLSLTRQSGSATELRLYADRGTTGSCKFIQTLTI